MKHRISRRAFLRGCTLLAASAAVGSLTSCGGTNAKDSSLPQLIVGSDTYPPYIYLNNDGIPAGIDVEIVGGGDVALEDAIYLARTCEKVYLIHRRDSLRGAMVLQEELKSLPSVEILYDHVVTEICGEDMVEKLRIKNVKTEEEKDLEVAGIFIAVGIHPNTELLQSLVTVGEDGYIPAGETGETDTPGIYVAGDIRKKPLRQVVTAVADGANAAVSAGNYCNRFRKQS